MVPAEGRQRRGGEYVSDGGILLEVAGMASGDLLDAAAGGMVVMEELRERDGLFTGSRVQECVVQIAVGVAGFIMDISGQSIPRNGNRHVKEGKGGIRNRPGEKAEHPDWERTTPYCTMDNPLDRYLFLIYIDNFDERAEHYISKFVAIQIKVE
eukprot:g38452.t1